jgi:hypothetical protein
MLGLIALSTVAWAADPPVKVDAWVDAGELEVARKKCIAWGGDVAGAEAALREACGRVWLADAKATDTVDGWAAFGASWNDTKYAEEALTREAELALVALGSTPTEAQYLALFGRYVGTPTGAKAYYQAGALAVAGVQTDDQARSVAERYPDQEEALVKARLSAFVTATVTADSVSGLRSSTILAPVSEVTTAWVAHAPDGTTTPWSEWVLGRLATYGFAPAALATRVPDMPGGPQFPLCYDPGAPDVTPGVLLTAAGGTAFLAAPWATACGPDAPPVFLVVQGDRAVDFVPGRTQHARLVTGDPLVRRDGWSDVRALVPPTGPTVVIGGRIVTPTATANAVQTFDGSEPWLELGLPQLVDERGEGVALAPILAVPSTAARRPLAPLVQRTLGFDPRQLPEAPAMLINWAPAPYPAGSVPLTPGKGDVGSFKAAILRLGLDPATLGIATASTMDLDGDGVIEVFAEGKYQKRPAVVLWQMSTGRVWAWVRNEAGPAGKLIAFRSEDATLVAWTGTATDVLRWTASGPMLTRLPAPGALPEIDAW